VFGFYCCDCTGFCANLQKREIIQLPLPSAQRKPEPCPHIHLVLGESIGERVDVGEASRDPQPPPGGSPASSLAARKRSQRHRYALIA
jgi:hypothetical protein